MAYPNPKEYALPHLHLSLGRPLAAEQQPGFARRATELLAQALVIHEIPAGSWGDDGQTQAARAGRGATGAR